MTKLDLTKPLDNGDLIDRIADGELTPAELRHALEQLDREPDGWKRCTLAFLEAQCWRESVRATEVTARSGADRQSLANPRVSGTRLGRPWLRGSIAAAIVAVSFSTGWLSHASRPWPAAERTTLASGPESTKPSSLASESSSLIRSAAASPGEDQYAPPRYEVARPVIRLRIGTDSAQAEVPILAGPGIDEEWLQNQPPPVSEHRQVVLQQHGYQVDQHRQFISTTLADGRRVTVPVDLVQVRYTGNNPL